MDFDECEGTGGGEGGAPWSTTPSGHKVNDVCRKTFTIPTAVSVARGLPVIRAGGQTGRRWCSVQRIMGMNTGKQLIMHIKPHA